MLRAEAPPLRWVIAPEPPPEQVRALADALAIPPALAALLVQRGHADAATSRRFLRPALADLGDPAQLAGLTDAVAIITAAVRAGQLIMVHGDYDVDGQCAAAVLTRTLTAAGARVLPFIPHRVRDGYDFGPSGLAAAIEAGVSLIVTCDCGITAVETVRRAQDAGIDVVITDHHLPGDELPPARAVVDPQQPDDTSDYQYLSGTGVAFKLVQALAPELGLPENFPLHLLDLVALATVADVVPLVGENRILVRHGLRLLRDSRWPGVQALIAASRLSGKELRAGQVGFVLAPRLNAAGRIGDANDGLRLLLSDDPLEAAHLAEQLEELNVQRQTLDQRMLDEALLQVEDFADPASHPGLVLAGEGWHPGVVGIVASRVVERFGRPTFLIAFDGELGKGSGRSISRFDLHGALTACGELLERFGGHQMAAGVTIRRPQLDAFRARFVEAVRSALTADQLGPEQRVDLIIRLGDATAQLERLCRALEPCGMGNPAPVFGVRNARFLHPTEVGRGHLKGWLAQDGLQVPAIGFGWHARVPWLTEDTPVDAAFRLECNEYQGRTTLQARLVALTPHQPDLAES
ncbi:MAG TPA: single-stranded-DNA-specific exonuclease RecJ [Gemmatimonadales bacterium]|nr:single-stranded-DNA-specific exonuclease RecJ [Gemmatimonadales bacterium]